MSYYRDVYLQSDEWKSLRLERLTFAKFRCELCGTADEPLDAHHLKYRRLFNVRFSDLRALCRNCHDKAHFLMRKYKKLKTLDRSRQWSTIKAHLAKGIPSYKLRAVCEWLPISGVQANNMTRGGRLLLASRSFSKCRDVLVSLRLVKRQRMKWSEDCAALAIHFENPIQFLANYIATTGIDPRYRIDRVGPHRLLKPQST